MILDRPLPVAALADAGSEAARLLADVQCNVLKPHGRRHVALLLLRFAAAAGARAWLRAAGGALSSAALQRDEARAAQRLGRLPTLRSLLLSHAGYEALGIAPAQRPADPAFRAGMKRRHAFIHDDPHRTGWEPHFGDADPHAVLLLADDDPAWLEACVEHWQASAQAGVDVLGIERGARLAGIGAGGQGVELEHFGFVDGISMPQFFDDGQPQLQRRWRPLAPLSVVLEPCPGGRGYGSYVVLRKLEQNVRAFARQQQRVAEALGLRGSDAARQAGALMIGRQRDGTPLADCASGDPNDFDYAADPDGLRCPLAAHVRKMNPRGSSEIGQTRERVIETERRHLLARRSIPYGRRDDDPQADLPPERRPESGVGLLFLAYQASVVRGYEFVQRLWADWEFSFGAPRDAVDGVDMLIAQGAPRILAKLPAPGGALALALERSVTLKGGEYLYAPSLSFFERLH